MDSPDLGRRRQGGKKLKFCKITVVLGLENPELWFTQPVVRGLGGRSETGKRSVKREKGRGCRQQGRWIGTTFFSATSVVAGSADPREGRRIHGEADASVDTRG